MGGDELGISARAVRLLEDLRDEWASLDRWIKAYDDELATLTREDDQARRLAPIPGVGVINATALLAAVTAVAPIPVIASGGAGCAAHMAQAVREGGADAVLAASIFHFGEVSVAQAKAALADAGAPVRL